MLRTWPRRRIGALVAIAGAAAVAAPACFYDWTYPKDGGGGGAGGSGQGNGGCPPNCPSSTGMGGTSSVTVAQSGTSASGGTGGGVCQQPTCRACVACAAGLFCDTVGTVAECEDFQDCLDTCSGVGCAMCQTDFTDGYSRLECLLSFCMSQCSGVSPVPCQ